MDVLHSFLYVYNAVTDPVCTNKIYSHLKWLTLALSGPISGDTQLNGKYIMIYAGLGSYLTKC